MFAVLEGPVSYFHKSKDHRARESDEWERQARLLAAFSSGFSSTKKIHMGALKDKVAKNQ